MRLPFPPFVLCTTILFATAVTAVLSTPQVSEAEFDRRRYFSSSTVRLILDTADLADKEEAQKLSDYFSVAGAKVQMETQCGKQLLSGVPNDDLILYFFSAADAQAGKAGTADWIRATRQHRLQCVPREQHERVVLVFKKQVATIVGNTATLKPLTIWNVESVYMEMLTAVTGFTMQPASVTLEAPVPTIPGPRVVIGNALYIIGGIVRAENAPAGLFEKLRNMFKAKPGTKGTKEALYPFITVYELGNGPPRVVKSIPIPSGVPLFAQGVAGDGQRYIYIAGGQEELNSQRGSHTTVRFDTITRDFTLMGDLPHRLQGNALAFLPQARTLHSFGGVLKEGKTLGSVMQHYMIAVGKKKDYWTEGQPLEAEPRAFHLAEVTKDIFGVEEVLIMGGVLTSSDQKFFGGSPLQQILTDVYIYKHHYKATWEKEDPLPFPVSSNDASAVPIVGNSGLALFTSSADDQSEVVSGHVTLYMPAMWIRSTIGSFTMPRREGHLIAPVVAAAGGGGDKKDAIWLLEAFSSSGGDRDASVAATQCSFRVAYRGFLVGTVGTPAPAAANALNVPADSDPVYMFLHTDGGITNLKMNIVAAADQAYRSNLVYVLPDMATDWVASRKKELAAGSSTLILNKCGHSDVLCRSFGEVFDANAFIASVAELGLTAVRNTLPRLHPLRSPSKQLSRMDRSGRYLKAVRLTETTMSMLCIKDHKYCHRKLKSVCDMRKARDMGASFVLSGVANYWHFNFTLPGQLTRRDALFAALKPAGHVQSIISTVLKRMHSEYNKTEFYALHMRIEPEVRVHCSMDIYKDMVDCYVPKEEVVRRMTAHVPPGSLLYVAVGNSPDKEEALDMLRKSYTVISKESLYPAVTNKLRSQREWLALVDQEICMRSAKFVGSRPSSFSFLVAAMRTKQRLPWAYYNDKVVVEGELQKHSTDFVRLPSEDFRASYDDAAAT